jgi:DinB superfamily
MNRPDRTEYADYYHGYIALVPDGDICDTLARQQEEFLARLREIPEERGDHRYAAGKWTVKEVIGHLLDTERVLGYRALAFARGDRAALPGFDQDLYVAGGEFGGRSVADLAAEFDGLRSSHLVLFRSFSEEVWGRTGTAGGNEFTVRAVGWVMAGHVGHHVRVLEGRYL